MLLKIVQLMLLVLIWSFVGTVESGQTPLAPLQAHVEATYEVYAISYGVIPHFPVAELVTGADKSRYIDIQMMVWLLKGPGRRNILVDSGFYREKFFKEWRVKDFIKPSEALAKVGLKAEDITDIIITHMHWDHADGIDLFPNARIWIQKEEFNYYRDKSKQINGIDPEDVKVLLMLNSLRRVGLVDGDAQEPIPGVVLYTGGRHTYASQYVGVNTKAGTVVIASDNLYLFENLEKHLPIALTFDAKANLQAQERMRKIAADPRLIIPGHDPEVFVRFSKPGGGVARIE